eukprot:jgi/Mesvir1/28721/Mv19690-RA.1
MPRLSNSGYCLLFLTIALGVVVAADSSGCPQLITNGTCLFDGNRTVLRVAYVVITGGFSLLTSPAFAIAELAFREVEANTSLLPSIHLQPIYSFYGLDDRKPVFEAVTKVATTPGLVALMGATSSQASEIVQLVASAGNIPQISSNSNSATLSNKDEFPTFMRTTISSITQVRACVALLRAYNWTEVDIVIDQSDLSVLNLKTFLSLAQDSTRAGQPLRAGLQVVVDMSTNLTEAADSLLGSENYITVVFCSLTQFVRLFSYMIAQDPSGAQHRNYFFFANTFMLSEAASGYWASLPGIFASFGMHPNVSVDMFYRHTTGFLGLTTAAGSNERTAQFEAYARSYNRSEFPGQIPAVIAGSSQLVVDAVYTIVHGLRRVLEDAAARNKTPCETFYSPSWDGMVLYRAMRNASFLGTSGPISYDENGDRIGTLNMVNLVNSFHPNGSLARSTSVVTHSWNAADGTFVMQAPTTWRDGSMTPPGPVPLDRARVPPKPPTSEGDGRADVKAWVPPVVIGIVALLASNALWMLRSKQQKKKVWLVDMGAIEWGPVKALDCGTSISDAVYHGVDVGVRRVPLSRTLLSTCKESFCDDAEANTSRVIVRSAFRVIDKSAVTVKVRAPKPYFDDDVVLVSLCMEPGRVVGEALGEEPGASASESVFGSIGGTESPRASSGEKDPSWKDGANHKRSTLHKDIFNLRVSEPPLPREQKKALLRGAEALLHRAMEMHHPNLERVIGGGLTKCAVYILLERLTGGSLHAAMQNRTLDYDVGAMIGMLLDAASALKYLHSQRPPITHGDLNPKSLFLDDNMSLKLSVVSPFCLLNSSLGCGVVPVTLEYAAPEVLAGRPATPASDVFSFGMMLWECFARADIYADLPLETIVEGVIMGTVRPKPVASMPVELEGLMYECLSPWPHRRPTFVEIHTRLFSAFQAKGGQQRFSALQSRLTAQQGLIDKIMPPHVAAALHRGETVPPERHDCVTIMFSDIVGFTSHSAQLLPIEVMQMLDRLYTQFDALTTKHSLFKVETIGDAYMVVGNLHPKAEDHTARIVRFAQDAIAVANTIPVKLDDPSMGTIHIRTGVHTGPVVASVVGTLNPRYCLFGDTVNMTNRIETSSQPDCVHLSQAAAAALRKQDRSLRTVKRGKVLLKGKGETVTYWLESSVRNLPENLRAEMVMAGLRMDSLEIRESADTRMGRDGEEDRSSHGKPHRSSRSMSEATDLVIDVKA